MRFSVPPAFRLAGIALILAGISAVPAAPAGAAQTQSPFTIDDFFRVQSLRIEDVTPDGSFLAGALSSAADRLPQDNARYGDPTYVGPSRADLVVIDSATGKQVEIFRDKEQFRSPVWSPDGKRLAVIVFRGDKFLPLIWNRDSAGFEKAAWSFPKPVASNSALLWSQDGTRLYLAVRGPEWESQSAEAFRAVTQSQIILMDSEKPFLPWDEVRRRDRLVIPVAWDIKANTVEELLPETPVLSMRLVKDGSHLLFERDVTEKTNYDVIGGTRNQLEALPLPGGKPRVLLKPYDRRALVWTRDNATLAYSDKGNVYVMRITEAEPRLLVGEKEAPPEKSEKPPAAKAEEKKAKQEFEASRFSLDGRSLLCTSARPKPEGEKPGTSGRTGSPPRQYWVVDVDSGAKDMVYELPEAEDARPSFQVVDWSPDGEALYFSTSAPDRYERGLVKLDLRSKKLSDLVRSDRLYSRWRMAEDGRTFFYFESDGDAPEDLYRAAADFTATAKLSDLNPWIRDKALSRTELIAYRDVDGKKLYGVLYYPDGYEKGKTYPLITEVYESYFENGFNPTLNLFTSAGYAVLHPSVNLKIGYPGEAWMKGALAAVNRVIEMGVADPDKLGIQGTSYGGYATVLLLTQTDRFKAAINNSGKVDMVSFYSQSPRLGIRNTHAPEKSQDRLGGTMWEYPERYLDHSAILRADRITTPLLCITGDQDPNVEAVQSQEIFIALRRLGKKCVWLRYHDGAHGGPNTNDERRDMYRRMIDWYDTYLKGVKK
jgi:dipeptidyl aminopeptidase/acylaminoacyl peptidase